MHKPVKRYHHSGEIRDDKDIPRLREELERLVIQTMKNEGYLPIHELGSHWSTFWKEKEKKYEFKLTLYAWYGGPKAAQEYDFWLNGRLIKIG